MTEEKFLALIAAGRESESLEAKPGGIRTDALLGARVVRAALGMANHEGGGFIVVGIEEDQAGRFQLTGIPDANLASWNHDDVSSMINGAAEPHVSIETHAVISEGLTFVVISVGEFVDVPVVCRKQGPVLPGGRRTHDKDVCYARSRRKPETIDAASDATTWRTLMDLAGTKTARKILSVVGSGVRPQPIPGDAERFADQLGDFR